MPRRPRIIVEGAICHVYNRLAQGETLLGERAVLGLLKLSLPEGHQPALENVSEILAGLNQAPAATKADAECALSNLTRAYSLLDGLTSHEVAPIQLRVSRLIESWQAVWSTRGQ